MSDILGLIKSDLGIYTITSILIFLFIQKNLNDIISLIRGIYGLKRKTLEEIIKNQDVNPETKKLAKQELTALYNYKLTKIINHDLRSPLVEIITRNKLPATYFKRFRAYLSMDRGLIKIDKREYKKAIIAHRLIITTPCAILFALTAIYSFISFKLYASLIITGFSFFYLILTNTLTSPPQKKLFDEMEIYIRQYNLEQEG